MTVDSPLAIGCAIIGGLAFAIQIVTCWSPKIRFEKLLGFDLNPSTAFFYSTVGIFHFALAFVVLGLSASLLEHEPNNDVIPEIAFTLAASMFALVVSIPSLIILTKEKFVVGAVSRKAPAISQPRIFFPQPSQ